MGRLVERVGKRVEGGREGTLQVAKRVSHYQARIKETTRRMMAVVSELSMQQVRNEFHLLIHEYSYALIHLRGIFLHVYR